MNHIEFKVVGKPHGQGRVKAVHAGGFTRVYKAKTDRLYEGHVRAVFEQEIAGKRFKPFAGPVILTVAAVYLPAKSMRKAHRVRIDEITGHPDFDPLLCASEGDHLYDIGIHRIQRPDLSNIIKAVEDGLNEAAFLDDRQVVWIQACKIYAMERAVYVAVQEIPL